MKYILSFFLFFPLNGECNGIAQVLILPLRTNPQYRNISAPEHFKPSWHLHKYVTSAFTVAGRVETEQLKKSWLQGPCEDRDKSKTDHS